MKKLSYLLSAAAMTVGLSAPVSADMVLDTFDYDVGEFTLSNSGITSIDVVNLLNGSDVNYELSATGSSVNPNAGVFDVFGGLLSFDSSNFDTQDSSLTATYSGGSIDFSNGDTFYVDIFSLDPGSDTPAGFKVDITLTSGTGASAVTLGVTESFSSALSSTREYIGFDEFVLISGNPLNFDLTDITEAVITYTNYGAGADFSITEIGIVPAPAAIGLLGLGLMGVGFSRRRAAK